MALDDLGTRVDVPQPVRRVVSLVPSLSEAIATTHREALVGVTDWCTHPSDLDVTRVRGTKNPDVARIIELSPDLVVANQEENRQLDVRRLRDANVPVWVTVIESVPQAIASMSRMFDEGLGWRVPPWLDDVRRAWDRPMAEVRAHIAVAVWRDPWMVVGRDTFTGDLLRRVGYENVFAHADGRYPRVELADIDRKDIDAVLLPDEPYVFSETDGPEAFTKTRTKLVSGRTITWYGPSLLDAAELDLRV